MALFQTQTYSCHGTSTWKKKLYKAKVMYMNLRFGILLVEPSFEFVAILHPFVGVCVCVCVCVCEIKTTSRNTASRPSIPLPLMYKVTWSMCTKFSTFHHRGSLPSLLSYNQKGSARISARTCSCFSSWLQMYVKATKAFIPIFYKPFKLYACLFRAKVL